MKRRQLVNILIALFILTGIAAAFLHPLFWPKIQLLFTPDFGRSDAWHFTFPTKYALGQSLHAQSLPTWTPVLGTGFPLIGEGQTGTFFLPNLILYRVFEPVIAFNISYVLLFVTAGMGMFAWLMLYNVGFLAALFGAITCMLSGTVIAQMPHLTLLQGFTLLPAIAAGTVFLYKKRHIGSIAVLSILLSQQLLSGFPQASFITILFITGYYGFFLVRDRKSLLHFYPLIIAYVFMLGLSACQILPSYEFLRQTPVSGGFDLYDAVHYSFPLKHFITFFRPFALGNPKFGTYPPFNVTDGSLFWENTGFIGFIPWLLIAGGLLLYKKINATKSLLLFFLCTMCISLLLMNGKYSPVYLLFSFWPFNLFRVPSRFIILFTDALIFLSAVILHWMQKRYPRLLPLFVVLLLVQTVHLYVTWHTYQPYVPYETVMKAPDIQRILPKGRIMTIGYGVIHNKHFLASGWNPIDPYVKLTQTLERDSNLLWNIPSIDIYAGRWLHRMDIVAGTMFNLAVANEDMATVSANGVKFAEIFGVQTFIAPMPINIPKYTQITAKYTPDVFVYTYPSQLPRAYFAHHSTVATTQESAMERLFAPDFIPGSSVLLEQDLLVEDSEMTGSVRSITENGPAEVRITVEGVKSPRILVLRDTFYPGWTATVDGVKTTIFPANIMHRAIIVPPGSTSISFRYEPRSLYYGMMITAGTSVLLLGWVFLSFRTGKGGFLGRLL